MHRNGPPFYSYNASIVGARLAGCGLHAMEVITACIGMVPPFTHTMHPLWGQGWQVVDCMLWRL